jgi:AcrR family transcriptional regulator
VAPPKSQRERLLEAMIHVAAREGYAEMSIADLTSRASVSRQTFYDLFADKEDCFLAAYLLSAERVLSRLQYALSTSEWWDAPEMAMRALLEQMESEPETAWLFFVEGLAGGQRVRRHRNKVLDTFDRFAGEFLDRATTTGLTLDVPPIAIVGAIRNIAAHHLRTNAADRLPELLDDLVAWMRSYATPAGRPRWSTGPHALLPPHPSGQPPSPLLTRPQPLPRGRHNLPPSVVARNHRERILYATADVATEKGYVEMTVADIVNAAAIGRDVFYEHFADKHQVFLAAQQHTARETLTAVTRAFFSGTTWPERVYRGLRTLTILVAKEPALTHLRLVEPYAAGPDAIERLEDLIAAFALFVEEGYYYRPEAHRLPPLFSSAIASAVSEIIRHEVAAHRTADLPRHIPELTYITIAPFTGAEAAADLVEELSAGAATAH